jgi:hypothetical protein
MATAMQIKYSYAYMVLLVAHQVHWRVDAFGLVNLPRANTALHLSARSQPRRACALARVQCCAGGTFEPEENEGDEGPVPRVESASDGSVAADGVPEQVDMSGKAKTRKAFQLAWKQKFAGKGADLSIPSKEEATEKLGREVVLDPQQLQDLRARVSMLAQRMESAVDGERYEEAAHLRDELQVQRLKDPLQLRETLWKEMKEAGDAGDLGKAASLRLSVQEVERYLPQYKLGGEWEGIYASHGKETVHVRYEGSTLVAVKMTGDDNVPKGEITFTADLSPEGLLGPAGRDSISHPSEKIRLVLEGHLENIMCFKGRGQVAKPGFKSPQFIDGQLLVFEEGVLGFIFLPLASMIVFEVSARTSFLHNLAPLGHVITRSRSSAKLNRDYCVFACLTQLLYSVVTSPTN